MSGIASEPSPSAANGAPPAPGMAPWGENDAGLPGQPPAPALNNPQNQAADQLPTIGHIGRYALKYQIGEGGLGRVYAAHDPLLSRLIAIKTLNLEISADERESFNALFLNEARAAGGLSHPHIVTVFDAGVSEQSAYIAMELLKGRDLRQLRLEGWKPTPTQSALIVRRVADALAYAHSKGVVHRDIKPANIFMVGRTQPRVLDFGIARVAHHHESPSEGDIAGGSPYYMAPEQVRHEPVDRRGDVFSLGVVLYELLTGTRPFRGASLKEITDAVVDYEPPTACEVDASVPKALSDIAARAMEKNPEHRYRSARALSRELRHWLEEHAQEGNDAAEDAPVVRKTPFVWIGAAVAAVVIAGAGWFAFGPARKADEVAKAPVVAPAASALVVAVAASAPAVAIDASAPSESASAMADASASSVQASAAASMPLIVAAMPAVIEPAAKTSPMVDEPGKDIPKDTPKETAKETAKESAKPASKNVPKPATAKETPKERRAREARERESRLASTAAAPLATGVLRLAISPWGQVEVDGRAVGTTPPLNEITLPEGRHTVTIRNDEFPPYSASINVSPGQTATLKYRFGS